MFDLIPSSLTVSFLGLVISFHLLAPHFKTTKQVAWILTTLSSATMSLASLPFLRDYLASGGSVKSVSAMPALAITANRFFQAYLAADLVVGSIHYRSSISLLEGWIHHSVYILVVELAIRRSWAHIFCFIRRAGQKRPTPSVPSVVALNIVPGPPVLRLTKPSESTTITSPPNPRTVGLPLIIRLSHRRQSFEKIFWSLRADFLESPSSRRALVSRAISPYLPRRETVYEYVGLGRD
ncbi:hypothetical protein DXG03_008538 [Asterophora parasitica]|uniref:Uncharacterized protein n=1 Tax=Asterophora parasitica TaxID=117018 RepID=A0A9P7KBE3_9AGAR|nr:hypothetical protein DXG03_008538 [Asterophora parasitica]